MDRKKVRRFKTIYEKENIKKFIDVYKIEIEESGTVIGGIIIENIYFEARLCIFSKNTLLSEASRFGNNMWAGTESV